MSREVMMQSVDGKSVRSAVLFRSRCVVDDTQIMNQASVPSPARISKEELRRHWLQCVADTASLPNTDDAFKGFICGFRTYEKMAMHLGLNMTNDDSKRFIAKGQATHDS